MHIFPYQYGNSYSGNAALLVDFSRETKMLVGTTKHDIADTLSNYKIYMQEGIYLDNKSFASSLYNVYTVDIAGYRPLYAEVNGELKEVFGGFTNIIKELLQQDMHCILQADTCAMSVLSATQCEYITVYLNRHLNLADFFKRNYIAATRLVNIAIPASIKVDGFYMPEQDITDNDGEHETKALQLFPEMTYGLTDFKYIQQPVGTIAMVKKQVDLSINIVMTSCEVHTKILCIDASIDEVRELEGYCTVTDAGKYWQLSFPFNANRTYKVTANTNVLIQEPMSTGTAQVVTQDMYAHAKSANMLYNDKYILATAKGDSITLPATYKSIKVTPLPMQQIRTAAYDYGTFRSAASNAWTAASYHYIPVQVNETKYSNSQFRNTTIAYGYGNLETFMIALQDADTVIYNYDLFTATPLNSLLGEHNFDTAFAKVSLPTVVDGYVTFRNIRYRFDYSGMKTNVFDGKKFALVLVPTTEVQTQYCVPELAWSSNYVVLKMHVNFASMLAQLGIESTDDLSVDRLYQANEGRLLPYSLAFYTATLRGRYTIEADASTSNLDMELPLA